MSKKANETFNVRDLTPAYLIHPGEILLDELDAREINQIDFAESIGMKRSQLNEYIKGKRDFNTEFCLLIGKALNINESFWLNLQQNYEVDKIKIDKKKVQLLEDIAEVSVLNSGLKSFLKKNGIDFSSTSDVIQELRNLYGVNHLSEISLKAEEPRFAYHRKSVNSNVLAENLLTWESLVKREARQCNVSTFDADKLISSIDQLKTIFKENQNTVEKSRAVLADVGVKLVCQENPPKCAVDGVSFWSDENPVIGLSLRFSRVDNFAFTLLHEIAHIVQHLVNNHNATFLDIVDEEGGYGDSKEVL